MRRHRIAVIAGDGIGPEVMPEGIRVTSAAAATLGVALDWTHLEWSCEYYRQHGRMMPDDGMERLRDFDAIYLGAVGWPTVPDHVSLWQLLMPIRRQFDLYVNLRPCRVMPGLPSPLVDAHARGIDFWIVRENTEGEYSSIGGRMFAGTEREQVTQTALFTRTGVDRIIDYAFQLAARKGYHRVTSATKSNGIAISMPFWDERFAAAAARYPQLEREQYHIDILAAHFVRRPEHFQVVVASNLFGDILSDLGPAVCGSIGIAPSANLNPERRFPSMFEPVHGSAPDIAGRGIANPIGMIWSGGMMLEHLGHPEGYQLVLQAIEASLGGDGPRTPDMGGTARTTDVGAAIAARVGRPASPA